MNTPTQLSSTAVSKKYRPLLTELQIKRLLDLAHSSYIHYNTTDSNIALDKSIVQVLAPFVAKIESDAKRVSYISNPRPDLIQELGGKDDPATIAKINKVAFGKAAYAMYLENPATCSLVTIEAAREYMYVNDLMSNEQERIYEASISKLLDPNTAP